MISLALPVVRKSGESSQHLERVSCVVQGKALGSAPSVRDVRCLVVGDGLRLNGVQARFFVSASEFVVCSQSY